MMTEKLSENSVEKPKRKPYSVKSPSRGGARKGAGRKKGVTNKVAYTDLLDELQKVTGKSYAELVAEEITKAIAANDSRLTKDYLEMIGKKAIADRSEMDVTTQGEAIQGSFVFVPSELSDWNQIK